MVAPVIPYSIRTSRGESITIDPRTSSYVGTSTKSESVTKMFNYLYIIMQADINGYITVLGVRSSNTAAENFIAELAMNDPHNRYWVEVSYNNDI